MSVEYPYESRGLYFIPIKYNNNPAIQVVILNPFYKEMSDLTGKSHLKEGTESTHEVNLFPKPQVY